MILATAVSVLDAVFEWTWQTSLQASVLIALAWVIQRLLHRPLGPRGCYLLSLLILLRLLLPHAPASELSLLNLGRLFPWTPESQPAATSASPMPSDFGQTAVPVEWAVPVPVASQRVLPRRMTVLKMLWCCGVAGLLAGACWEQRRFSKWVSTQEPVRGSRVLGLLNHCRALMRVRQPVAAIATEDGGAPALFGWWKPRLLLPKSTLAQLTERELAMVILHELAHARRRDILLNWVIILVGALHWPNPLVWLAMRRLRADRELVCDAMVLRVLDTGEQQLYGQTLLKLLGGFSSTPSCPSLVPVITNKQEIKRRIIMISNYHPGRRTAYALTLVLLLAVCALTFTRAADRNKQPAVAADNRAPRADLVALQGALPDLPHLQSRLDALEEKILRQQLTVDHLRLELGIPSDVAEGKARSTLDSETIRMIERERINAATQASHYESLLKELKALTPTQLVQAVPTAIPDAELTQLLRDLNSAESQRARLTTDVGAEHPQMRAVDSSIATIKAQIKARVEGIMSGLSAQMASQKAASDALTKEVREVTKRDTESFEKWRPYFRAKRDLEILEKVRDMLMLQLVEKQFGQADSDLPDRPGTGQR